MITSIALLQVVVSHLWMMKSLHSAICAPRLHVDLHPLTIYHDVDFVEVSNLEFHDTAAFRH